MTSHFLFALLLNSSSPDLHHAKLLIFADNMKKYLRINSISDYYLLQKDFGSLVVWSESFSLSLNIPKCFVLSFSRLHSSIIHNNFIHNSPKLFSKDSICDLGFTLTPNLSPIKHIETICCNVVRLLKSWVSSMVFF